MQNVSQLYRDIMHVDHSTEPKLVIAGVEYGADTLFSLQTRSSVFSGSSPTVGDCVSSEIDVELLNPDATIPRQAEMQLYVRITDGTRYSEWLPKGIYYIDTREADVSGAMHTLKLHGYDAMLRAEADYPTSTHAWPSTDMVVLNEIAAAMGVTLDARTVQTVTRGYAVQYPGEYSQREVLGHIAAAYAGCFIISETGKLRLVKLNELPAETFYLVDDSGDAITFGGDRILV